MTAIIGVRDLAEMFFGSRPKQPGIITMIRAAFDLSKDENPPTGVTSVAGYIGPAEEWQLVEEKWLAQVALEKIPKFRLTTIFHEFKRDRAIEITQRFAKIISESKLRCVGAYMLDTDWSNLDKDSDYLSVCPHRQHACLDMLLGALGEEANLYYKRLPIAVVFDDDYGNTEMAARVYEAWRARTGHPGFGAIAFTKGTFEWDVVPLQCADLLAGLLRKSPRFRDELGRITGRERESQSDPLSLIANMATGNGVTSRWSLAIAEEIAEITRKIAEKKE